MRCKAAFLGGSLLIRMHADKSEIDAPNPAGFLRVGRDAVRPGIPHLAAQDRQLFPHGVEVLREVICIVARRIGFSDETNERNPCCRKACLHQTT